MTTASTTNIGLRAKRWFGPYVVISVNDNVTYHLAELDGTRMTTPVVGKQIKAFKRRNETQRKEPKAATQKRRTSSRWPGIPH